MRFLERLFDWFVAILGVWTVAYQLVFASALPARYVAPVFALLLLPVSSFLIRQGRASMPAAKRWRPIIGLAVICAACGFFSLVNLRPDGDDLSFFHRAVAQDPSLPITRGDTAHDLPDLPALSVLHVLTSWEYLVTGIARVLGIEPVWFIHNVAAFIATALLPALYALLFRQLGLGERLSVACAAGAVMFLLLEGTSHASFGNVSLVRFWQGKTVLWSFGLPLLLFLVRRYMQISDRHSLLILGAASLAAVGLSNSGVFLFPAALFCYSAACVLAAPSAARVLSALKANACSVYCLALAGAIVAGLLPEPVDTRSWQAQDTWWTNMAVVTGNNRLIVRDLFLLLVLPWFALASVSARTIVLIAALCIVLFFNPVAGPVFHRVLHSGAFYRLLYILPLPLCGGLLIATLCRERGQWKGITVFAAGVLSFFIAHPRPVWMGSRLKAPREYRFERREAAFTIAALPLLHGRVLLAPNEIVNAAGLLDPGIRFPITRMSDTFHLFRNSGVSEEEAWRRAHAQHAVTLGEVWDVYGRDFASVCRTNATAVAFDKKFLPALQPFLGPEWRLSLDHSGFVLLLR